MLCNLLQSTSSPSDSKSRDIFPCSKVSSSSSLTPRLSDLDIKSTMPSRMDHAANMNGESGWHSHPYYEGRSLGVTSEAPLGWTFDQDVAALSSQNSSVYHDYVSPFSNSVFEGLPDITWDQTSPETTNPTTPSSPSYLPLPTTEYAPDVETCFTPGPEAQQYPTPRLLPKSHSPFELSIQHRLRGYQHRQGRQRSPQLVLERRITPYHRSCDPCISSSLATKREHSPGMGLDFTVGDDDDGTPDPQLDDTDGDATAGSEPYAQLIYRALKSVPGHSMVLKDIYEWFEKNTDKPQTSTSAKGWQNSIRHNLSMNGVRILEP